MSSYLLCIVAVVPFLFFFFFQAEDGIRDLTVTGVQTCALPISLEGALKLKEISYIHAEGYAGGEMKHGPIALIADALPVVALVPRDGSYERMLGNIEEVRARDGLVVAVAHAGDRNVAAKAKHVIEVPPCAELLARSEEHTSELQSQSNLVCRL